MRAESPSPVTFAVAIQKTLRLCFLAIGLFAVADFIVQYALVVHGLDYLGGFSPLFNLDQARNIPTWFSGVLLLSCASLLAVSARGHQRAGDPDARFWWFMAGVFLMLSMDEASSGHEVLTEPWDHALQVGGVLRFAWVVPVVAILGVVGGISLGYVSRIEKRTRNRFIFAGIVYVGAAVGLELLGSHFADGGGRKTMAYCISSGIEESLEMVGLVLMLRALLLHLQDHSPLLGIRFGSPGDHSGAGAVETDEIAEPAHAVRTSADRPGHPEKSRPGSAAPGRAPTAKPSKTPAKHPTVTGTTRH